MVRVQFFWSYLLQLNKLETVPLGFQSKPKFEHKSLLFYMFSTSCDPVIFMPVLQTKTKTMSCARFVETT